LFTAMDADPVLEDLMGQLGKKLNAKIKGCPE
jgi:hypothetical protein